ncbi:LysE family translocator [Arcobacter sp. LA11]|uniref:LysE family translocator n=1 Tax=Arcobacter sp. LA11 TaxID=1898176 RepID=UPI0009346445|nr:LysE family translocator [Arcobacter sp. LA11]
MENLDFWLLYILTVFIASIIPGPSMLLALTHGLKYGTKISIATAIGNTTASMIQASIAVTGLGIVLTTSTTLFMIIKYAGAIYLIYLGIKLFKTPFNIDNEKEKLKKEDVKLRKLFTEAFIVAASNPKALVFFTALFPQFISEGQNNILHYSLLVIILGVIAFVCMMIYTISANLIKELFNKSSLSKYFGKVVGSLFISLGAGLAFAKKS